MAIIIFVSKFRILQIDDDGDNETFGLFFSFIVRVIHFLFKMLRSTMTTTTVGSPLSLSLLLAPISTSLSLP